MFRILYDPGADATVSAGSTDAGSTPASDSGGATESAATVSPPESEVSAKAEPAKVDKAAKAGKTAKVDPVKPVEPVEPVNPQPEFDLNAWTGDLAVLPDVHKPFAERYRAILEAEYKPQLEKYKDYVAPTKMQELQDQLALYKQIADGGDDPRLLTEQTRVKNLMDMNAKLAREADEKINKLNAELEQLQKAAHDQWMTEYKQRHAAVFADKAKHANLVKLLDNPDLDLDPDAAATIVLHPEPIQKEILETIAKHKAPVSMHKMVVDSVLLAKNIGTGHLAEDSPAAMLTSGADGSYPNRNGNREVATNLVPIEEARKLAVAKALKAK